MGRFLWKQRLCLLSQYITLVIYSFFSLSLGVANIKFLQTSTAPKCAHTPKLCFQLLTLTTKALSKFLMSFNSMASDEQQTVQCPATEHTVSLCIMDGKISCTRRVHQCICSNFFWDKTCRKFISDSYWQKCMFWWRVHLLRYSHGL